jgi:hypothetical protein
MCFESEGTLFTDPPSDTWNGNDSSRWWAIIECDPGIGDYYRWLLRRKNWIKLMRPAWGTHISVVRGECPKNQEGWSSARGTKFSFKYQGIILSNESHFWIQVTSPQCLEFRRSIGLPEEPELPLHITLGMIPPESVQ